jgi:hypothetical protein
LWRLDQTVPERKRAATRRVLFMSVLQTLAAKLLFKQVNFYMLINPK